MSDFPRTTRVLSQSILFSAAERCGLVFQQAWRVHPVIRLLGQTWGGLGHWQRLRVIGWILIVAMFASAVAQILLSPRGLLGPVGLVALLGIGVALFSGCKAWVRAWEARRDRGRSRV